jgi:hypothetical protein
MRLSTICFSELLHERADQRLALLVVFEPGDERAVDLERIDGELLEVGERGVAGAEVVDRNPHPRSLIAARRLAVSTTLRMSVVYGRWNRDRKKTAKAPKTACESQLLPVSAD